MAKRVYLFNEGHKDDQDLLGGKGANLCEMTNLGLPVPFGFIITTDTCREFFANGNKLPNRLEQEYRVALDLGRTKNGLPISVIPTIPCYCQCAPGHRCPCRE